MELALSEREKPEIEFLSCFYFGIFHVGSVVGIFLVGASPTLVALAFVSYTLRMWAITAGYHRYFSHRSYKTSRAFQFILAVLGTLAFQKGPLWWAAHHRHHHRHADEETDLHSPSISGIFWAHIGWILCRQHNSTEVGKVKDLAKFPELVWLNRYHVVPPLTASALVWVLGGPAVFVWVVLVATVFNWHAIFTSNSLAHMFGRRNFDTKDTSKNNIFVTLIMFGEGWHNNHHYYPGAARQGFYWWEVDFVYYSIKFLELLGLVWEVREPPAWVLEKGRRKAVSGTATG